jgi:outer membrane protein TolC
LSEAVILMPPAARPLPEDADTLVRKALLSHPYRREADLQLQLAENARRTARASLLPTVGLQGGWEFNGATLGDAEHERVVRRIEVDVRAALARLAAARARQEAGRAALTQARESQRIVRDRYEGGLATVTDVLRAAEAALEAESRATAAEMDVILQGVALDRALGRL